MGARGAGLFNAWIRDLVRETAKKCSLVPLGVFLFGLLVFVLSEAVFFVSIFWASFHLTSSPLFIFQEALFIPDPCELTYGNTLLLSNAAVSLGSAYITRESLLFFGSPHSASVVFASTFLSLQIKEFRNLGFYVSDSVYGCVFFFLSGFHFFHVVVGLVLLGILSSIPLAFGLSGSLCISQDFFFLFQVLYWHLVELVWQFLFVILYLHSPARPGSAPPRTGAPIPSIMTPRRAGFRELGFETAGPEASPGGVGDYDSRNS
jgi:heme/copper-type cytochrome/quinol oxidase subunit 3